MRKYLLPESGNFYKANLHCHSTISDGRWTPEQLKENYMAHGYSIVAYTDHAVFVPHNDLADDSFLPLNGYELDISPEKINSKSTKTCHICFIATEKDRDIQRIFYDCKHLRNNLERVRLDPECEYLTREYSTEAISKIMTQGAEDGFFVTYNHPAWSFETRDEYCNYNGMHAMEIVNYGCVTEGYDDRNSTIYSEMLRGGKKLYCIATDDNHNKYPVGHSLCDSFGGFTMIKAEKLEYKTVTDALLSGSFYASEGPAINSLYFEDGKIYIETSEASRIVLISDNRRYRVSCAEEAGAKINSACFEITEAFGDYVRFEVADENGKCAYTNAYFLSELL